MTGETMMERLNSTRDCVCVSPRALVKITSALEIESGWRRSALRPLLQKGTAGHHAPLSSRNTHKAETYTPPLPYCSTTSPHDRLHDVRPNQGTPRHPARLLQRRHPVHQPLHEARPARVHQDQSGCRHRFLGHGDNWVLCQVEYVFTGTAETCESAGTRTMS